MLITGADVPLRPLEAAKEPDVPTAEFKVCVNTPKEDRAPRSRLQRESTDSDGELILFEMQKLNQRGREPPAAVCLVYCIRSNSSN